jgi:hypothetical protein
MDATVITPHSRRHPDRGAQAEGADDVGGRAGGLAVVVDARRPAGFERQLGDVPPTEGHLDAHRPLNTALAPADVGQHRVRVVAAHDRQVDGEHPPDLGGDRGEHLLRRHRLGHQGRDPAQRRLLLGEPAPLHLGHAAPNKGPEATRSPLSPNASSSLNYPQANRE